MNPNSADKLCVSQSGKVNLGFFARPTLTVAEELLGMTLVRKMDRHYLTGMIVETEAYIGEDDPASHAFGGRTPRNAIMFGPPGQAYVYFIYGNHFCLNFVTEKEGFPAAVLIRGLHPLTGTDAMRKNRGRVELAELTNGPGKLCQALRIDGSLNGISLATDELFLLKSDQSAFSIDISSRIGVSRGKNHRWRFFVKNDPFVSNSRRSK